MWKRSMTGPSFKLNYTCSEAVRHDNGAVLNSFENFS